MNFAQLINRFYNDYGEPDTNRFPIDLLKEWFDEAETVINGETKLIRSSSITDAVNSQRLYSYPSDCLDKKILAVYFSDNGDSDDRKILTPTDTERLDRWDRLWRTRTGTPKHWYHEYDESKWGIYRYPTNLSGVTNCVKIVYAGKHTKMTHYYTTGTVSITSGTDQVTGSGTTFSTNLSAGDKIGIGKLLDPTRATAFPSKWYEIESVDGNTTLTLTENFAEATVSGGSYIACSNSTITYDEINLATILYVMSKAFRKDKDFNLAEQYEEKARFLAIGKKDDILFTSGDDYGPDLTLPYNGGLKDDYGLV